jgi:hypothetical protein
MPGPARHLFLCPFCGMAFISMQENSASTDLHPQAHARAADRAVE